MDGRNKIKPQIISEADEMQQYRTKIESSCNNNLETNTAVIIHDQDGIIVSCNIAAETISGVSRSKLIGKREITPEWEVIKVGGTSPKKKIYPVEQALLTQNPVSGILLKIRKQDRTNKNLLVNAEPVFDSKGKLSQVIMTCKDIEIQDIKQLEQSENRALQVLKRFPGALYQFKVNKDGMFSMPYVSEGAANLFGLCLEEIKNVPASFEVVHPDDRDRFIQSIETSMRDFSPWSCEYRVIMPSGDIKWVLGESIPERLPDGSMEWNGLMTDITKQKENELIIHKTNSLLESIREANASYLSEQNPENTFQSLLHTLISITESEFGFLDEVLIDENGNQYKMNLAMSDISWDSESKELYRQLVGRKLEFRNLDNLAGLPVKTGEVIIANNMQSDSRSMRIPKGHPPMNTFMGLPLYYRGELVGVAGVANRTGSYNMALAEWLEPFLSSYAGLIHSLRLRRKEQKLHETVQNNLEMIDALLNASPDSVFLMDTNGTVFAGNELFATRLGVSLSELIGENIYQFLPNDIAQTRMKKVDEIIRAGNPLQFDDERAGIIFRHYLYPIKDKRGAVDKIAVFGSDITQRFNAATALRESEEKYRIITEVQDDVIMRFDRDLRHIYVSPSIEKYWDAPPDTFIGKTHRELGLPEDKCKNWELPLKRVFETGIPEELEFEFEIKSGNSFWEWRLTPETDVNGNVNSVITYARNITERKRAESALRNSEKKFHTAFREAPVLMSISEIETGEYLDVNNTFVKVSGYARETAVGRTSTEIGFISSADRSRMKHILEAEGAVKNLELELSKADGSKMYCIFNGEIIEIEGKKRILSIATDITEQKKAEKALNENRANLLSLIESTDDAIVFRDLDHRAVVYNTSFIKIIRKLFDIEALQGIRTIDYMSESRKSYWEKTLNEVLSGKRHREEFTWEIDGKLRYYEITLNPILSNGKIIGTAETTKDITDRAKYAQALKDSAIKLQEVVRAGNVGLWDWNIITNKVYYSPEWKRQIGYEDNEISDDLEEWRSRVHPDEIESVLKKVHDCLSESLKHFHSVDDDPSREYKTEFRFRHKDGSYRWILAQGTVLRNEAGQPVRLLGSHVDITNRKIIELQLRENEEKFRAFYNRTPVMLHSINKSGYLVSVSDYWLEKTGYARDEVIGKKSIDFLTQQSRKKAMKLIPQLFRNGNINNVQFQFVCKGGELLDVLLSAIVEYDINGKVLRALAVINDITDLVMIDQQLQQANTDIQKKAQRLEELNTALKVLLEQRGDENLQFERKIVENINVLIKPYIKKLQHQLLDGYTKTLIEIIQSNLDKVLEPINRDIGLNTDELSPTELQILNLIKDGKSTKEIAAVLSISENTVFTHRKNIRKKIGMKGTSINLETFLKKK